MLKGDSTRDGNDKNVKRTPSPKNTDTRFLLGSNYPGNCKYASYADALKAGLPEAKPDVQVTSHGSNDAVRHAQGVKFPEVGEPPEVSAFKDLLKQHQTERR